LLTEDSIDSALSLRSWCCLLTASGLFIKRRSPGTLLYRLKRSLSSMLGEHKESFIHKASVA